MLRKRKKPDESIYGDYEEKFDRDSPLPEKKPSLRERLQKLSYGSVSMGLFVLAALLFTACIVLSVIQAGKAGLYIGIMGLAAFAASLIGTLVALYGHFAVRIEGRIHWLAALIPNAALALILAALYITGLVA